MPTYRSTLAPWATCRGLRFDASAAVDFTAEPAFDLTIGVDLTPGLAVDEAVFIRPGGLSLSGVIDAADLNFGVHARFLDARVEHGKVLLDVELNADLWDADANGDARITLAELADASFQDLLGFDATSSLDVDLPVVAAASTSRADR